MNLNKVLIFGNLTRDPELRQTPTGQAVTTLGIATNSFFTDKAGQKQKKTEFHSVVVWGRQAEIASQYLKKGSSALIEGRLQTRSWQDKQGQARQTTEIVCERIQLGPRPQGEGGAARGAPPPASPDVVDERHEELPAISVDDGEIRPENIPF
ncbi:MAG: single-stranded DNA-binding protein [Patescibacteria group bacterium]